MSGKGELARWLARTVTKATTKTKPAGAAGAAKAKPTSGAAAAKTRSGSGGGPPGGGGGGVGGTTPPFIPPKVLRAGMVGIGGYLAASTAMAILFDDDDTPAKPQQWDAPDGSRTHILPASAASIEGVQKADSDLRTVQQAIFSFKDGPSGTVWGDAPPPAITLAGATETALTPFTQRSADLASQVTTLLQSEEPYVARARGQLTSAIDALSKQPSEATALVTEVKNADSAAAKAYEAFREANRSYRANLVSDGKIGDDSSTTSTLATAVQQSSSAIDAADGKIAGLFPAPAATTVSTTTTGGGTPAPPTKTPTPGTPTPGNPAAVTPGGKPTDTKPTDTKGTENKDLKDLLNKLGNGNNTNPGAGNPLGSGSGSPLGGGGTPLGGGSSTPLGTGDKPKLEDKKSEEKEKKDEKPKLEDKKDKKPRDLAGAKPLQDKAEVKPPADKKPEAAAAAPAGVPAGPPPAGNPQGANPAAAQGKPQSTEVDVKGTKVDFKDPKLAKLAEVLAAATPGQPVSLAEAAQKAGLTPPVPGQDVGQQLSPADAKPGNILVAGEREYLLLEDGKFFDTRDFKVVSADQIPGELGRGGGYFALVDPSPGQPVPGDPAAQPGTPPPGQPGGQPQGPVSPVSTSGVQQPVPGSPTGAPVGPVDPAAKPGSSGGATPAPPSNDGTGSGGGVPVSGSPGQPAEGKPSDAPGGAAGTQTAGGATGPSIGGRSMDPGSVR